MNELAQLLRTTGLPRGEATALLAQATGLSRTAIIADGVDVIDPDARRRFADLVARRIAGEPIAYLVGMREFFGRPFHVDPAVLIPRPDTELIVEQAIAAIDRHRDPARGLRILELGTGSGAIAISLACERPGHEIVASDVSPPALAVARRNAIDLGAAVRFVEADWYAAWTEARDVASFDLIVSNPPYIASGDGHLAEGDLRFEPRGALTDGADGLGALRVIVAGAPRLLVPGAVLMVEHGYDQADAVRTLFAGRGYAATASFRDLAGIERVTAGTWTRGIEAPAGR